MPEKNMASRRSRIKGIANIPQRRKPALATTNDENCSSLNLESECSDAVKSKVNEDKPEIAKPTTEILHLQTEGEPFSERKNQEGKPDEAIRTTETLSFPVENVTTLEHKDNQPNPEEPTSTAEENCSSEQDKDEKHKNEDRETDSSSQMGTEQTHMEDNLKNFDSVNDVQNEVDKTVKIQKTNEKSAEHKPFYRFIKPKPAINANRRIKFPTVKSAADEETKVCDETEISLPKEQIPNNDTTFLVPRNVREAECTLDETHIMPQANMVSLDSSEKGLKKLPTNAVVVTEAEYPPPPPSPSKLNRARIKAIPRFDQRRTSFSASESEDESRRYNRHRNDSVCSSASGIQDPVSELMSPQRPKEFNSVIQKKCKRTEQSRKLAEARREFQMKFGGCTPNRSKLTMIDLIFYNPSSNPMSSSKKFKKVSTSENDNESSTLQHEEESVDNPPDADNKPDNPENPEENNESDEENDIPAPQIKITPQGDIIIDEKSLVFESKKTKKEREELQQSAVIKEDDSNRQYGIYKRVKRSKDWDHSETLRFYKALNTIGTDFTLMCDLFPNRTRRELKTKFNKEERLNRNLVDRAIMQPCQFDYNVLHQEMLLEEQEKHMREENEKLAGEIRKKRRIEKKPKLKKERFRREHSIKKLTANIIKEQTESKKDIKLEKMDTSEPPNETQYEPKPKPRKDKKTKGCHNILSILQDDTDTESESDGSHDSSFTEIPRDGDNESDDEIIVDEKPTRYGRIPKKRTTYEPTLESTYRRKKQKLMEAEAETEQQDESREEEPQKYEPGSVMIVTTKGENGEPIYNVLMVTPDQRAEPVQLNKNAFDTLTRTLLGQQQATHENNDEPLDLSKVNARNILKITARPVYENEEEAGENDCAEVNLTIPVTPDEDETKSAIDKSATNGIGVENNITVPAEGGFTIIPPQEDSCDLVAGNATLVTEFEIFSGTMLSDGEDTVDKVLPSENSLVETRQEHKLMDADLIKSEVLTENSSTGDSSLFETNSGEECVIPVSNKEVDRDLVSSNNGRTMVKAKTAKVTKTLEDKADYVLKDDNRIITDVTESTQDNAEVENVKKTPAQLKYKIAMLNRKKSIEDNS